MPCLQKLHKFLTENGGVDVPFGDFRKVYFEVRDTLYAEDDKNLEEPTLIFAFGKPSRD
ncbi:MAG: hypothetical protein ACP5JW_02295 [Candidatus Bathyarchaeia archaeon]